MRGLKSPGLIISSVIALVFLLAASGLMLLTIGSGTPGTWKKLTGEDKLFGGAMSIWVLASGRYDSQGTLFDYAGHSASRAMPYSPLFTPVRLKIEMTRNYDISTKTFNDAKTGGYAEGRAGSFWRVQTHGESVYTYNLVPWAPATYTLFGVGRSRTIKRVKKLLRRKNKLFFLLFLSLLSLSPLIAVCKPAWIKNGARFDYEARIREIYFYFFNDKLIPQALLSTPGSKILSNGSSARVIVQLGEFGEEVPARISLVLKGLEDSTGIFQVTLEIGQYSSTLSLGVDLETRDVYLLNGTYLGKTIFWIPPCKKGERFPYVGQANSTIFATAYDVLSLSTPQGVQDLLLVDASEHQDRGYIGIRGDEVITPAGAQSIRHFSPRINLYDADTFIMIEGDINQDAFLSSFGIVSLTSIGDFKLVYTNIDLGPQNLIGVFTGILLLSVLPLAVVASVIAYYLRFRRKKYGEPR